MELKTATDSVMCHSLQSLLIYHWRVLRVWHHGVHIQRNVVEHARYDCQVTVARTPAWSVSFTWLQDAVEL
jgi:hypothetical protein